MTWFQFNQNNSGGSFVRDPNEGIGPILWIEAHSARHANERAEALGIYFDGVDSGDRWHPAWDDDGQLEPKIHYPISDEKGWVALGSFSFNDVIYIHPLEGKFYEVKS
jgi:hypothetical protein